MVLVIDNHVPLVAIPSLTSELGASAQELQWITDAHILINVPIAIVAGVAALILVLAAAVLDILVIKGRSTTAGAQPYKKSASKRSRLETRHPSPTALRTPRGTSPSIHPTSLYGLREERPALSTSTSREQQRPTRSIWSGENLTYKECTMSNSINARHERVQAALEQTVAGHDLVGIVAEVQDESGTWFGSAGVADLQSRRRREPGERFHPGSAGKAFTAAAMLTLEAEGRLSLDDTVEEWLPGVVRGNGNDGSKITIRHLHTHTSGLGITGLDVDIVRKYHTRAGFSQHRFDVWTVDQLLKLQLAIPPMYAPGEDFAYCNGGYHIAGAIIEKVTGGSYQDEVDRTVIRPLGLTGTYAPPLTEAGIRGPHPKVYSKQFIKDGVDPDSLTADNYESFLEDPEADPVDVTDKTFFGWSAAGVISTTGDMLRFTRALITGTLLPPAQHRAMWSTVPTRHWLPNTWYGTGVSKWALADGRMLHVVAGVELGSASVTLGTPDGEHMISIHTNSDRDWYAACNQIVEAAFGAPCLPPQ
ncbi:serine hydrolase domain-containing protein [Nonomuraea sp. NPDC050404]|uniref:serine hydrolase domain-containing protein n=1 Tax=Nonomuraea sp. NPDC050404 TaxID=3155783 RepID=UPI0033F06423